MNIHDDVLSDVHCILKGPAGRTSTMLIFFMDPSGAVLDLVPSFKALYSWFWLELHCEYVMIINLI